MQYKGAYLPFLQLLNKLKDIDSYLVDIVWTPPPPASPPSPFLKGGGVNFDYLTERGGIWKIKKGGGHIVQGLVFLKGGTDTFPI